MLGRKGWREDSCLPGVSGSEHKPLATTDYTYLTSPSGGGKAAISHPQNSKNNGVWIRVVEEKYIDDYKVLKLIKHSGFPVKFLCPYTQHQRCPCHFPVPCTGHRLGLFRAAKSTPERAPGPP